MRYKINTALLVVFILMISIFISNLANFVSVDKQIAQKLHNNLMKNKAWKERRKSIRIENGTDHLMWFVQISDIHLSIFRNKERQDDFREFASKTIDVIKPPIVLASGDLTDARGEDRLSSQQFKGEWITYKEIIAETNVANRTIWMDIRGNHDTFNVPSLDSEINYFNHYSVQGSKHPRSYMKQIAVGKNKYSFIAIDSCQNPGTKRPFNFIGILDVNQTNLIIDLAEESRKTGGDYIVWFGHYPTSTILSPGTGNRGLSGILGQYDEGYVYLSGHLHTLGGLIKEMYALQKSQFLELEVGDWKDNRLFRVAAFDHGLFSFVDTTHNNWPIILITNPKNAHFNIPTKEDPSLQIESTHIRLLIFDPNKIAECKLRIDGGEYLKCKLISNNLYATKWNARDYDTGIHSLEITVQTEDGRTKTIQQQFALDETRLNLSLAARFILMCDLTKVFQTFFGFALAACVLPICILRIWHELVYSGKVQKPKLRGNFLRKFFRKLWILSTVDRLLFPILLYAFYILVGPWSIGKFIDGHTGIIFSWGMFIKGHYLPGTLNYLHGYFQLMFCQFPLVIIYAHIVHERYDELMGRKKQITKPSTCSRIYQTVPFAMIITTEILLGIFFWSSYGTLAAFFGPLRIWSIVADFVLYYWALTLPKHTLMPAMTVVQ